MALFMTMGKNCNYVFISSLCFFVLFLTRGVINSRRAVKQISAIFDESRCIITAQVSCNSTRTVRSIEHTDRTHFSRTIPAISKPKVNPTRDLSIPQCTRDEIRVGEWKPVILDAPPYTPRTVHLRCYPESEYKKAGNWTHTYEWRPVASSKEDCTFSNWNRDDFCALMRRATVLVRARSP